MNRRAAPHRGIDAHYGQGDDSQPSKTQLKRASHDLQKLGQAIAALPQDKLDRIAMPEPLRDAIEMLRRTRSHEGRRRQLQYVGKLMRNADEPALREALAAETIGSARESLALHEAERWRNEMIDDDDAVARWLAAHPQADAQALRQLVQAARRDRKAADQRQAASARALFRFIKPLLS